MQKTDSHTLFLAKNAYEKLCTSELTDRIHQLKQKKNWNYDNTDTLLDIGIF